MSIRFELKATSNSLIRIPDYLLHSMNKIVGHDIVIKIEKRKSKISDAQRAYYFAAIIPAAQQLLSDWGNDLDEADTHEVLKSAVGKLSKAFVNSDGVVVKIPGSITDLDPTGMKDYIDKCVFWLNQNGVQIL